MEEKSNKSTMVAIIAILVIIVGGVGVFALTREDEAQPANNEETSQTEQTPAEPEQQNDIVSLAVATPSLSTLVTAVQAADLVETLQGDGPFTVLAPTNDAFAALPAGTLDSLLLPENVEQLSGILTYHVIAGSVLSSDLTDGQVVETVNGGTLTVDITDEGVFFVDANGGRAQVTTPDVEASNGVVHIIDAVLLP
jgi:uncharacterized surface protein with fasciclin (FAS1) repeats